MSIINIVVRRHCGLLLSDTLAVDGGGNPLQRILGGHINFPKIHASPHAQFVIGFRGLGEVFSSIRAYADEIQGFDNALRELPEMLTAGMKALYPTAFRAPDLCDPEALKQELYLVGWSEGEGCMAFARFWMSGSTKVQRQFVPVNTEGGMVSCLSLGGAFDKFSMPETAAELARLTALSATQAWATNPHLAIGGKLIVAEVTRDAINLANHGSIGLPAARLAIPEVTS